MVTNILSITFEIQHLCKGDNVEALFFPLRMWKGFSLMLRIINTIKCTRGF